MCVWKDVYNEKTVLMVSLYNEYDRSNKYIIFTHSVYFNKK